MANETEHIVVFEIDGNAFGLELDRVEGIVEKDSVIPVPMAPPVAKGVTFYRNGVLPVINLHSLLNSGREGDGGLLVVVRGESEDFGICSDRIYGIIPAALLNLRRISSEERENPYIQGIGDFNGVEVSLLDIRNIK